MTRQEFLKYVWRERKRHGALGCIVLLRQRTLFLEMGGNRPSLRLRDVLVGRFVVERPAFVSEPAEGERLECFLCLRVGLGQLPGMYDSVESKSRRLRHRDDFGPPCGTSLATFTGIGASRPRRTGLCSRPCHPLPEISLHWRKPNATERSRASPRAAVPAISRATATYSEASPILLRSGRERLECLDASIG